MGRVTYTRDGGVATIAMDDGKVNAMSLGMIAELGEALDRAQADGAAVLLRGRPGVFCAGFDLATLRGGNPDAARMLIGGFELAERIFSFPAPVVAEVTGHALAMGVFLVLAADYRLAAESDSQLGASADPKIGANEVAIGLVMPHFAVEMCRQRLTPACFQRAVLHAEIFPPAAAREAGFVDQVVPAAELAERARREVTRLAALPRPVYAATKERARALARAALLRGIELDRAGAKG